MQAKMQTCWSHSSTMHAAAERKLVAWGRDSCQGHQSCAISLTNISPDMSPGELWVGTWVQTGAAPSVWDVCKSVDPGVQYPVLGALSSSVVSPTQFVQVVQVWGRKKARLFCSVGYISMGCCSLRSTAALLPGKHARLPGLKFVLCGWPDHIL